MFLGIAENKDLVICAIESDRTIFSFDVEMHSYVA